MSSPERFPCTYRANGYIGGVGYCFPTFLLVLRAHIATCVVRRLLLASDWRCGIDSASLCARGKGHSWSRKPRSTCLSAALCTCAGRATSRRGAINRTGRDVAAVGRARDAVTAERKAQSALGALAGAERALSHPQTAQRAARAPQAVMADPCNTYV